MLLERRREVPEIAAIGAAHLTPGGAVDRRFIDLITGLAGWAGENHRCRVSLRASRAMTFLVPLRKAGASGLCRTFIKRRFHPRIVMLIIPDLPGIVDAATGS